MLSTFISLLCSPFINYLEDKGLPRAITVVLTLSFLVGASIIGLAAMSEPAKQWWSELPSIVKNVSQEVSEVTKASADHLNTPLNIANDMSMDEVGNNTVFSLVKNARDHYADDFDTSDDRAVYGLLYAQSWTKLISKVSVLLTWVRQTAPSD